MCWFSCGLCVLKFQVFQKNPIKAMNIFCVTWQQFRSQITFPDYYYSQIRSYVNTNTPITHLLLNRRRIPEGNLMEHFTITKSYKLDYDASFSAYTRKLFACFNVKYLQKYSKTFLNQPTVGPTSNGLFREVVGLES